MIPAVKVSMPKAIKIQALHRSISELSLMWVCQSNQEMSLEKLISPPHYVIGRLRGPRLLQTKSSPDCGHLRSL
jgi:hypothetical protein